jgi:hypothetical protein
LFNSDKAFFLSIKQVFKLMIDFFGMLAGLMEGLASIFEKITGLFG